MASATSRPLPLLLGFIVLTLLGLGCLERASETLRAEPRLSKQAIVALVAQNLTSSGLPEAPLRKDATRTERNEYLEATQGALDQLRKLSSAKSENRPRAARLLLDSQSEQILAVSRLLAVELSDAIDRADPPRAIETIRLAAAYAAFISDRSVPDWLASAGIADMLAVGIKSVAEQLDVEMAEKLSVELSRLEASPADPATVLMADALRIDDWLQSAEKISEPVTPESIQLIAGIGQDSRRSGSDDFVDAVESISPTGYVPPDVFIAECRIAADSVSTYLKEPRGPLPDVDASRHPIAAYFLSILRPTYSEAAQLVELRKENWRLLALTLKIAAGDAPEDLSMMGDLAISPVTLLPFEYVRREADFDLARPRTKAGSAS